MKVVSSGPATTLADLPAGAVFGRFVDDQYVRWLKIDGEGTNGQFPAACLAPHLSWSPGAEPGPTVFPLDGDDYVIPEPLTIRPKTMTGNQPIEPSNSNRVPLGSIVFTMDGRICLLCRSGHGMRAWVELETGKTFDSRQTPVAHFPHYVLTGKNELGDECVIFDSEIEQERFKQKRSA